MKLPAVLVQEARLSSQLSVMSEHSSISIIIMVVEYNLVDIITVVFVYNECLHY